MAIAPFINPLDIDYRLVSYNYDNNELELIVEGFAPFFDEDGVYNEYNIATDAVIMWTITPSEFFYIEPDGLTTTFLNSIEVTDTEGASIEFGMPFTARRASKIKIRIKESYYINALRYKTLNSLFNLKIEYLPDFIETGSLEARSTATKKVFTTAPLKVFTNSYLNVRNQTNEFQFIAMQGINDYLIDGKIEFENKTINFVKNNIPATALVSHNTLGFKNCVITLHFDNSFLIPELKVNYNSIVSVVEKFEDYTPQEKLRFALDFPEIDTRAPEIAPNEWVVEDNINASLQKMYNNLLFILEQTKIVNPLLKKRLGWYDTVRQNWNYYINNISGSIDFFTPVDTTPKIKDIFVTKQQTFLVQDNKIKELTKTYSGTITDTLDRYDASTLFVGVDRILVDSENKLYVFDKATSRIGIFKKNYTRSVAKWVNQVYFGGVGGRRAKSKFLLPNSIFFDNYENLHVVDTGNSTVKKYSNDGSWLATLFSSNFDNTLIDGVTDSDNSYHILKPKTVVKMDYDGNTILEYNLYNPDSIPIKIITDALKDFILVVYKTKIQKYYKSGKYVGTIYGVEEGVEVDDLFFLPCQDLYGFYWSWDALSCAQNLDLNPVNIKWADAVIGGTYAKKWANEVNRVLTTPDGEDISVDFNIYSAFIDQDRNLFIAVGGYILKFVANTTFVQLREELKQEYFWDIKDLLVHKEDIVQDWVYNRSFQRMWDNIEVVRKSITQKLNAGAGSYTATPFSDLDLDFFTFTKKDDIIIGQNEVVTVDVVNRVIQKLWNNIRTLNAMINYRQQLATVVTLTATP